MCRFLIQIVFAFFLIVTPNCDAARAQQTTGQFRDNQPEFEASQTEASNPLDIWIDLPLQFDAGKIMVSQPQVAELMKLVQRGTARGDGEVLKGKYVYSIKKQDAKGTISFHDLEIFVKEDMTFKFSVEAPVDGHPYIESSLISGHLLLNRTDSVLVGFKGIPFRAAVSGVELKKGKLRIRAAGIGSGGDNLPQDPSNFPIKLLQIAEAHFPWIKDNRINIFGIQLAVSTGNFDINKCIFTHAMDLSCQLKVRAALADGSFFKLSNYEIRPGSGALALSANILKIGDSLSISASEKQEVASFVSTELHSAADSAQLGIFGVDVNSFQVVSTPVEGTTTTASIGLTLGKASYKLQTPATSVSVETSSFGNARIDVRLFKDQMRFNIWKSDPVSLINISAQQVGKGTVSITSPMVTIAPAVVYLDKNMVIAQQISLKSIVAKGTQLRYLDSETSAQAATKADSNIEVLCVPTKAGLHIGVSTPSIDFENISAQVGPRSLASSRLSLTDCSISGGPNYLLRLGGGSCSLQSYKEQGKIDATFANSDIRILSPLNILLSGDSNPTIAKTAVHFDSTKIAMPNGDSYKLTQNSALYTEVDILVSDKSIIDIGKYVGTVAVHKVQPGGSPINLPPTAFSFAQVKLRNDDDETAVAFKHLNVQIPSATLHNLIETLMPDQINVPPQGDRASFIDAIGSEIEFKNGCYLRNLHKVNLAVVAPNQLTIQFLFHPRDDKRLVGHIECFTRGAIRTDWTVDYRFAMELVTKFEVRSDPLSWHNGLGFSYTANVFGAEDVNDHFPDCPPWPLPCVDDMWGDGITSGFKTKLDSLTSIKPKNIEDISEFDFREFGSPPKFSFTSSMKLVFPKGNALKKRGLRK